MRVYIAEKHMLNLKEIFSLKTYGTSNTDEAHTVISPIVYHGGFRKNDRSRNYFYSSSKQVAASFQENTLWDKLRGVQCKRLTLQNPLIINAQGREWYNILFEGRLTSTNGLAEIARQGGHDSVVVENVIEGLNLLDDHTSTTYIQLSPEPQS